MEKLRLMKVWLSPLGMKGGGPEPEDTVLIKEHLFGSGEEGDEACCYLRTEKRKQRQISQGRRRRIEGRVRAAIVFSYFSTLMPQAQWCVSRGDTSGSSWLAFYFPIHAGCWAERSWQWISLTWICLHKGVDSFTPFTWALFQVTGKGPVSHFIISSKSFNLPLSVCTLRRLSPVRPFATYGW